MLSGQLLPAHPKPFNDEILTSWLIRLAKANGMKLQTFSRIVFEGRKQLWNRDIDRSASDWLISALAEMTSCSKNEVFNLTLKSYEGVLFNHYAASGILKWILPLNIYHRKRRGYGQQYCHECFKEDEDPYFRKHWRVAFNTFCVKHNIMLNDRCPNCGSPVMFHRCELGRPQLFDGKQMCFCTTCEFDLRLSNSKTIEALDTESFPMFYGLQKSIQNGVDLSLDLDHLNVLRQFCKLINSSVTGINISRFFIKVLKLKSSFKPTFLPIESDSINTRHRIIQLAIWVLFDWKKRIKIMCEKKVVRYNYLVKNFEMRPVWYIEYTETFNRRM